MNVGVVTSKITDMTKHYIAMLSFNTQGYYEYLRYLVSILGRGERGEWGVI